VGAFIYFGSSSISQEKIKFVEKFIKECKVILSCMKYELNITELVYECFGTKQK
jgi:hypothetical protein